jgi:hypothetical protein
MSSDHYRDRLRPAGLPFNFIQCPMNPPPNALSRSSPDASHCPAGVVKPLGESFVVLDAANIGFRFLNSRFKVSLSFIQGAGVGCDRFCLSLKLLLFSGYLLNALGIGDPFRLER